MALEFGLGITPWSPLKSGALSGKYTRKSAGEVKGDRGFMESFVNEKAFTVVDALEGIARSTTAPSREWHCPGWRPSRACPRPSSAHGG